MSNKKYAKMSEKEERGILVYYIEDKVLHIDSGIVNVKVVLSNTGLLDSLLDLISI